MEQLRRYQRGSQLFSLILIKGIILRDTIRRLELKYGSLRTSSATYTAEISTTSGFVFSEGSTDQIITVVITRTGPAHAFVRPLTLWGCVSPTFSSRWPVKHGTEDTQSLQRPTKALRSMREDLEPADRNAWMPCAGPPRPGVSVVMPDPTPEQIQANDNVTTSATVRIPVRVDRRQVSNFETYYQTIGSKLSLTLQNPREPGERVNPDTLSTESVPKFDPGFEDDEEDWVPWVKEDKHGKKSPTGSVTWPARSGGIPVVVRPANDVQPPRCCPHPTRDMSGQVVMSDDMGCKKASLVHYLSDGARGPIFVDRNDVQELRAKEPAERALLTPLLQPVISSPLKGEERAYRYYTVNEGGRSSIYVGETWARKVAYKDELQPVTAPGRKVIVKLP